MESQCAISVECLGKCYHVYDRPEDRLKQALWRGRRRYFREFWALRDVSFEVRRGETVGIIGRNGSGKSTLLQILAGTLAASEGEAKVSGRVAALLELGSGFNPDFSGRENVYLNAAILGLNREEIDQRFQAIADFAGIGQFMEQPVKTYSSGMMLRLAFAVSINVEPDILIVDEALAVGDLGFQLKCMERLNELTKSGITLLFVSHDILTVKSFCSRAVYLEGGRVKGTGSASDMTELYLMDIRDAQRREMGSHTAVRRKAALAPGGVAFGTEQGYIERAAFVANGGPQWACMTGDTVELEVELTFDPSVKSPSLSIVLHDHRMLDLSGRHFPITGASRDGYRLRALVRISIVADLNSGVFPITIRLEDRASDEIFFPIDKQAGVLQLHVNRPANQHFIGLVKTNIRITMPDTRPEQPRPSQDPPRRHG